MASHRFHRHRKERTCNHMLSKSCLAVLVVLLAVTFLIRSIKSYFNNVQTEDFPLNQLERGYVSRQSVLSQLRELITLVRTQTKSNDPVERRNAIVSNLNSRFAKQISRDLSTLEALGYRTLTQELSVLLNTEVPKDDKEAEDTSFQRQSSDIFNRYLVTHRFCYEQTLTPQGGHRQVDPSFCPRLIDLLNDIQHGRQPPLLTLFTWIPDPLEDVHRLRRRLLYQNWNLLRPIVQPVMFSDSRTNMAFSNSFDWPCLPVLNYSSMEVPIFKYMANTVAKQFNSTFYGYVRPTTLFDASLVETLLKLKDTYIDKYDGGSDTLKLDDDKNPQSGNTARPILSYGRALRSSHVGNMETLEHISEVINSTESHVWADRKDSLVYFLYAGVDFEDIPDFIVDDRYLTSLLVSRSMALGHLVVDASSTIYSVHIFRNTTTTEWGREYLHPLPRDPYINRHLGARYFHSRGMTKPKKWLNEIGTKYSRNGNIFIDIRNQQPKSLNYS